MKIKNPPLAVRLKQNLRHLRRLQNPLFRTTVLGSVEGRESPSPTLGLGPGRQQPPCRDSGQLQVTRNAGMVQAAPYKEGQFGGASLGGHLRGACTARCLAPVLHALPVLG